MRLSISEARRRLPELVRRLRRGTDDGVQITVHDEIVAELRAADRPVPGMAAKRLVALSARLPKRGGRKTATSSHTRKHLYGRSR